MIGMSPNMLPLSNPKEDITVMKKWVSFTLIAAMSVILALTGCSNKNNEPSASPSPSEAATGPASTAPAESPSAKPAAPVTLRLSTWDYSDRKSSTDAFIAAVKEKFNVTIQLENVPTDQYESMIKAKFAAEDGADLVNLHSVLPGGYEHELVQRGMFADISGISGLDDYLSAAKEINTVDGKLYTVSISTDALGVIYNKKVFQDLGIAIPTNIDEFTAAMDKIKAAGIAPIAGGFKDSWAGQIIPFIAIAQYLQTGDHDMIKKYGDGSAKYNEPTFIKAQNVQSDWAKAGYFQNNFLGSDINVASAMVGTGKAAMLICGTWQFKAVQDADPAAQIGFFALPLNAPGEPVTIPTASVGGLAVNANGKHVDVAKQVLEYYLSEENQTRVIADVKGNTTNTKVKVEDPFLSEVNTALTGAGYVASHWHGFFQVAAIGTHFDKGWQNVLAGGTTNEKLAEEADKIVAEELANKK